MKTAPEPLFDTQRGADRLSFVVAFFALLLAPFGLLAAKAVVPLVIAVALGGGLMLDVPALPRRVIDRPLAGLPVIMTDAVRDSAGLVDRIGKRVAAELEATPDAPALNRAVFARRAGKMLSRSRYLPVHEALCKGDRRQCSGGEA